MDKKNTKVNLLLNINGLEIPFDSLNRNKQKELLLHLLNDLYDNNYLTKNDNT